MVNSKKDNETCYSIDIFQKSKENMLSEGKKKELRKLTEHKDASINYIVSYYCIIERKMIQETSSTFTHNTTVTTQIYISKTSIPATISKHICLMGL